MKRYLGDGVYVEFDGFALWLTTENGIVTTNRVCLEPEIWRELCDYVANTLPKPKDEKETT